MNPLRNFLVKAIAIYFRSLELPASFPKINSTNSTFVTLDDSLVLDGLLYSMAQKAGLESLEDGDVITSDRNPKKLYRLSNHKEESLRKLSKNNAEHIFITVNTIHGIGPIRTTRNYSINIFDALSLLIGKRFLVVVFGEGRKLNASISNPYLKISRSLKLDFYKNLKLIRGTPFQSIRSQSEAVLSGKDYQSECQRLASDLKISSQSVNKKCRHAFQEVAANPVRWVYLLIAFLANTVVNTLFKEIKVEGISNFISGAKEQPVILVPMHRSHLDYIILGAVLYKSRLNTPLVAAGINLNFWPAGFFLRRVGAFFVKRTGGSDPIHTLVIRRYIAYLLKRGHLLEFFIEGGRSRTGRMRPPKLGLLKTIIGSFQRGARKDIIFIPVSISYEQVIEDKAISDENIGGKKVEENFQTLVKARSIFKRKYGEVIINFGNPISLAQFSQQPAKEKGTLVTRMARRLTDEMRIGSNPTFTSLACTTLLMAPRYGIEGGAFTQSISNLARLIEILRSLDPKIGQISPTLNRFVSTKSSLSEHLGSTGLVLCRNLFGQEVFSLSENRRITADFYKNSTIHLFIPFSLMAISELLKGQIDHHTIKTFHEIFEHDFLLPNYSNFRSTVDDLISRMLSEEILIRENDHIKFKSRENGLFIPALMLSPIQSNLWVIFHLAQIASSSTDTSTPKVLFESFVSTLTNSQDSALEFELLTRTETFSRSSIESTIESLSSRGIISTATIRGSERSIRIIDSSALDRKFLFDSNEKIVEFLHESVKRYRSISLIS